MQPQSRFIETSYQCGQSPVVLSEIFAPATSVAVWQRPEMQIVHAYFQAAANKLGLGIREVFAMSSLRAALHEVLPDALGKEQAVEDIYLIADMLTCLFDCQEVGLRLASVDRAMCPRFHVDNIPVRLITTYVGEGTQWLPNEYADASKLGHGAQGRDDSQSGIYANDSHICQMQPFDVALLKGAVFDEAHLPAIHRSCPVDEGQKRVLLTLDPI